MDSHGKGRLHSLPTDDCSAARVQQAVAATVENRPAATGVYNTLKDAYLKKIKGSKLKELLIRDEEDQNLDGFAILAEANAYLKSEPQPDFDGTPVVRIYDVA